MSPLRNKEAPAWFSAADYKAVTQFDMCDWCSALWARDMQQLVYTLAKSGIGERVDTPEDKERFWSTYRDKVMFWNSGSGRAESNSDTPLLYPDWTSIKDVTDTVAKIQNSNILMIHRYVAELEKRLLIVDPRAPDTELLRAFKAWLQHMRKSRPLPTKRRGRGRTNVAITDDHLERWCRYVVPACLDLDFYAEVFGTGQLTHEALCDLLAPTHQGNPKDWGREARNAAKEAFECVDVLGYQTSGGTN
jgi:hypothetical protein